MKKIPDLLGSYQSYQGIRLYRDDIELILFIFQENEYTVTITDKEFEFNTLDELIDKRGMTPTYFEISGKSPDNRYESIRISFYKKRIEIHPLLYSQTGKIIFLRIKEICELHISIISKILNPWFYFTPMLGVALVLNQVKEGEAHQWLIVITTILLTIFLFSALFRERHQVVLRKKHEGGFWKRNLEKIWLLVIGGALTLFFKFILELIFKKSP